jgi:ABC-type glycerol-3-phosphate transport system permease component
MARAESLPVANPPRTHERDVAEVLSRRPRFHFPVFRSLVYLLLSLGAVLFLMPFVWMVATSLKTPNEIARGQFLPASELIGIHSISQEDLQRPMVEFLYAEAEIDFRGVGADILYESGLKGGVFDVYIDNQFFASVDTYSPEPISENVFTVDSYPAVSTLTTTQKIRLLDERHTLKLAYNPDASRGAELLIIGIQARAGDDSLTFISSGSEDFEVSKGYWQSFMQIGETTMVRRSINLGFPKYFEACCFNNINNSRESQAMDHYRYISQKRPSGGHAVFRLPLTERRYVITGGASHYLRVWDEGNFGEYFINTVIIALLTVTGQTVFAILAAYAFAKIEFPGRNTVFAIFLLTIFIPEMVTLIPNLLTVTRISTWSVDTMGDINAALGFTLLKPEWVKWIDNWPGLVVPFLASTFSIFLLRQFFLQIPNELWDAAQIDGAGHLLYLFRVVVPISRAAITTVVLFSFIGTWDALEWPLLVTSTDSWRPISVGIYNFRNDEGARPNLLMAGSMIALFPVIVAYFIAQKQFTEGIATTGLKG